MKVLLVGHACSPIHGSEPSFTWNWAWHLSALHDVWALVHPHERKAVEDFLRTHPNPKLRFIWITPSPRWDPWKPTRGERLIRLHYLLWQRAALNRAIELHRHHHFDLVHHVSWGTVSAPPLLWRLSIPFVWGPVGGAQTAPPAFRRYFGQAWRKEALRTLRVRIACRMPSFRKAARKSDLILATNAETLRAFRLAGASELALFLDSGITSRFLPKNHIQRPPKRELTLLWVGRLEPGKALPLALEAVASVRDLPLRLVVAGEGPLRAEWQELAKRLGVANQVQFLGRVSWQEMPQLYREADVFIFTSLRDSFGTQVLEAMAHALPILTLDHQGVGCLVPKDASIKVPVQSPRETVKALGEGIRALAKNPGMRSRMGEAGWEFAKTQSWEQRAERIRTLYTCILTRGSVARAERSRNYDPAATRPDQVIPFRSSRILGVRVDAVQIPEVVERMERWIGERNGCHWTAVTGMHGVTQAQRDPAFRETLNAADLVVPDGMPLVWLSRLRGHRLKRRVYGPELMLAFCEQTARKGYRHFFYGGAPGVPEHLAKRLQVRFPGLQVVGTYSPPFRPLRAEEDEQIVAIIKTADPDVLWVGLSTPKQELWMHEHRDRLNVPVIVGVGAAFDINSGRIRQAPRWMREHGLEWLFRLIQEPRRLWRRYLLRGSQFLFYVTLELLGLKKSH